MVDAPEPLRGEIWWAGLPAPRGSEPGFRRPVLIVQSDIFNRSRINTAVVAVLTSNLRLGGMPGNLTLSAKATGLPEESVLNVAQLLSIDRSFLSSRAGKLSSRNLARVDEGLRYLLGL